jgi:hypothetical protein
MSRLELLISLLVVLTLSFSPALAQSAAQNRPATGSGSIYGHVAGMGKPLAGAAIVIWRQPHEEPTVDNVTATGRTNGYGNYSLKVPAGIYFIAVRVDGFLVGNENEPVIKSLRRVAVIDRAVKKVDFDLVPEAAFEGTVTDDEGKTVPQAAIWVKPDGIPAASIPLRYSPAVRTDLLGRYRITGLPAGRYRVAAGDLAPVWDTSFGRIPHRHTFYPDAADQSQARIIDVSPGAEIKQIDINMGPALRTFTVRVRLVADRDGPMPNAPEFILEAFYQGQRAATVRPREASTTNGEIVIPNVPAGEYSIHVFTGVPPPYPYHCPQITNPKLIGRSDRFEVIDRDVAFDLHITP